MAIGENTLPVNPDHPKYYKALGDILFMPDSLVKELHNSLTIEKHNETLRTLSERFPEMFIEGFIQNEYLHNEVAAAA